MVHDTSEKAFGKVSKMLDLKFTHDIIDVFFTKSGHVLVIDTQYCLKVFKITNQRIEKKLTENLYSSKDVLTGAKIFKNFYCSDKYLLC